MERSCWFNESIRSWVRCVRGNFSDKKEKVNERRTESERIIDYLFNDDIILVGDVA